jgi:hypothetical protein
LERCCDRSARSGAQRKRVVWAVGGASGLAEASIEVALETNHPAESDSRRKLPQRPVDLRVQAHG